MAMSAPAQMTHASVPPTTNSSQVNSVTQATESSQVTNSTTDLSQSYSQMSAAEKKASAVWTNTDDAIMVHKLIDEKSAHPSVLNGFKGTSWAQVVKALEGSEDATGSKQKDVPSCKSHWYTLKRLYTGFKTVKNMSGAGWDETLKMGLAKGNLMETTANEGQPSSADVGNDSTADLVPDLDPGEDNPDNDDTIVTVATTLPTTSPTKRKRSSAISPDVLFSELKNMSASLSESMSAPLSPITFTPMAPTASIHMQACVLVQKHPDLEPQQIFDVIDFLALNNNSGVHVLLSDVLRATWLQSKMRW
ncbi:hypothetical protein PSHT_13917 [Puccinia striiformis]|uniref:Myb/SANT-like domain-containing protein n=1 Tax=Puccinia striiformis TaxID=27350 RepID=A0A2S4UN43_9BASI|nr:hypothetical protein PSHT_13917 [Puccinia striiformis]